MISEGMAVAAPDGPALPDPNLHPPTVAESGDPFAALRVVHLLARLPRGQAIPIRVLVTRLNREYIDWTFAPRVVTDTIAQLQANWMSDFRTAEGIRLIDGAPGPTVEIEDSSRAGPWLVDQAWRLEAECRAQLMEFARGEGRNTEG